MRGESLASFSAPRRGTMMPDALTILVDGRPLTPLSTDEPYPILGGFRDGDTLAGRSVYAFPNLLPDGSQIVVSFLLEFECFDVAFEMLVHVVNDPRFALFVWAEPPLANTRHCLPLPSIEPFGAIRYAISIGIHRYKTSRRRACCENDRPR